jgi:hypothetical protein
LLAQYVLNQQVLAIMLEQHPLNHLPYGNHAGKTLAESAGIWQPFLHNACWIRWFMGIMLAQHLLNQQVLVMSCNRWREGVK